MTAATKTKPVDFAEQRQTLLDLQDGLKEELAELAARRRPLTLDVALGKGGKSELEGVERVMLTRTNELDRVRSSIAELDRRQAASEAQKAAAARRALEKVATDLAARYAKIGGQCADLIAALLPIAEAMDKVEHELKVAAGRVDRELGGSDRKHYLLRRLVQGRLDIGGWASPESVDRAETLLRAAPELPLNFKARRAATVAASTPSVPAPRLTTGEELTEAYKKAAAEQAKDPCHNPELAAAFADAACGMPPVGGPTTDPDEGGPQTATDLQPASRAGRV